MKKQIIKTLAMASATVMLLGTAAYAGTSYSGYNTTVGRLNGNGYTDYQKKDISGANGYIASSVVGGAYLVDARMNSGSGNGSWLRDVTDGTSAELPGNAKQKAGCSVRLQFSNDVTTPVNVQVSGEWKSN